MAVYNPYYNAYPSPYQNPYYPQPTYQTVQPMQPAYQTAAAPVAAQQSIQPPMQNGGFVQVRSFEEVRGWPIAPGNTVTFIDETRTHMYTKTAGYNQLEAPVITSYLIVREGDNNPAQSASDEKTGADIPYALKDDVAALAGVVRDVNDTVTTMKDDMEKISGTLYGIAGKKKSAGKKDADDE